MVTRERKKRFSQVTISQYCSTSLFLDRHHFLTNKKKEENKAMEIKTYILANYINEVAKTIT